MPVDDSESPIASTPPLGPARMVWLLVGRGDLLPFLSGPLTTAILLAVAWFTHSLILTAPLLGGVAFGGWVLVREMRASRGLRVDGRSQPELAELVTDTARRLSLPVPDQVWLTADANAMALSLRFPRRHNAICLGICSVSAMSAVELRATVAHEITHLTHLDQSRRRLVNRLLVERQVAAQRWERLPERRRQLAGGRRLARFLAETQPLAHSEELRADAAAVRVVPAGIAARALAVEYAVSERFLGYVLRCVTPLIAAGLYPSQLHSGWIAWCGTPVFWSEEFMAPAAVEADTLADEHPSLAARIGAYDTADLPVDLTVPHPASVLRPLGVDQDAALSRHFAVRSSIAPRFRWRRLRPVRWADVPERVYDSSDSWLREALTTVCTGLLGRAAREVDVVDLIAGGRRAELQPTLVSHLAERAGDPVTARASAAIPDATLLAVMLHPRLRSRGYRWVDPIAQHLLTGPGGDRFDLAATSAAALADPDEFARLRGWLFHPDRGLSGV